ncbi:MAG: membrane protein insertase YidC [Terracidiphilus sp.]
MAEIRNPNLPSQGGDSGGGGDSRGLLVFTLLALVVLLGYQYFFKPKPATAPQPAQSQQQQQSAQPATPQPAGQAQTAKATAAAQPAQPTVTATTVSETTVENENFRIVFTNQGAQVKQWILKNYKDTSGKPLDMVQAEAAKRFGLPLSLVTYDTGLTKQLSEALYQVSATAAPAVNGKAAVPATSALTFHYSDGTLDVLKTVRFDASYVVTVEAAVRRNGQPVRTLVSWPAGLGDMEEFSSAQGKIVPMPMARTPSMFAWSINGKQDTEAASKVSGSATLDQPYEYAAITDLYFTAAFLPDAPSRTTVMTLHNTIDLPSDPSDPNSQKRPADVLGLAVGDQSGYTRLRLYAGPKQLDQLKTIHANGPDGKQDGPSLEPLIQFGWLTVLAKPLYLALRFNYNHVAANWGWSIIIFTVIFNLFLLPTRVMMMRSSLKMMRIQPKVETIKRKYANLKATDPKRAEMNQEMMALYKTEGVNMYGGCLPMLLQMPLFFAYYRVLYNAVELRQAHWFWLSDLSVADPLHILPAIIIVSMFLTQYITPSPGMDPAQRRMMAFMMPVIMGFTLWHFASGLALYWCTGNLINLGMQIAINQSPIGKEMHAIAARRAAKKAGAGPRTIQGRR